MTPEEKTKHQDSIKSVIELLQLFHDNIGQTQTEPDVMCSHCGQVFETKALVIKHVSVCKKNPLVDEIKQLRKACRMAYQGLCTYDDEAAQDAIALIDALDTNP